jgi:hypothetical protein
MDKPDIKIKVVTQAEASFPHLPNGGAQALMGEPQAHEPRRANMLDRCIGCCRGLPEGAPAIGYILMRVLLGVQVVHISVMFTPTLVRTTQRKRPRSTVSRLRAPLARRQRKAATPVCHARSFSEGACPPARLPNFPARPANRLANLGQI